MAYRAPLLATPKRGYEVAYKEIAAFSIGSMGLKGYGSLMTNYIQMAAMCLLTGTVYGLSPTYIMILYILLFKNQSSKRNKSYKKSIYKDKNIQKNSNV